MNFLKTAPREAESSTDTTFVFCDCSNIILDLGSWILDLESGALSSQEQSSCEDFTIVSSRSPAMRDEGWIRPRGTS